MVKADRISALVLFVVILLYAITGYGMVKGFLPRDLAQTLHFTWLGIIGLLAFTLHTFWALHLLLMRHQLWNKITKILLPLFYFLMISFFLWLNFFYPAEEKIQPNLTNSSFTDSSSNSALSTANISPVSATFTLETLAQYNGKNGQPAYIAVDGVVYDVSSEFRNGNHHGYSAGTDLSEAFHRQHAENYLEVITTVGVLQEN